MLVFNWDAPPAFADFYTAKTGRRVSMFLWPLSRIRYAWTSWFFTAKWRRFLCCRRIRSTEENTLHPICAITSRTDVYFLPLRINKRTSPVTLPSRHYCVIFDLQSVVFFFFIRLPNHLRSSFTCFSVLSTFYIRNYTRAGSKHNKRGFILTCEYSLNEQYGIIAVGWRFSVSTSLGEVPTWRSKWHKLRRQCGSIWRSFVSTLGCNLYQTESV